MGQHEMVNGTIAWVRPTARSWAPMLELNRGILGTQDVSSCKRP